MKVYCRTVQPTRGHPAITRDVLLQLQLWQKSGLTYWASIEKLRLQTVPSGYTPHAWNGSKSCFACNKDFATPCLILHCLKVPDISTETKKDCLRSIIAQFMYQYQILELEKGGKNFRVYAYTVKPEIRANRILCEFGENESFKAAMRF